MSLDPFADRFDAISHPLFVKQGIAAFSDAVYRPKKGGQPITGCRCLVNRNVEFVGDQSQVPTLVTTLDLWRSDVPAPRKGDTVEVGGQIFVIDGARSGSSGAYDTYVVKDGAK